jgi:hypothetical protein
VPSLSSRDVDAAASAAARYAADSSWKGDYTWKAEGDTAIPLDGRFYRELFANGSRIGMKMFEQDFLCSINSDTGVRLSILRRRAPHPCPVT